MVPTKFMCASGNASASPDQNLKLDTLGGEKGTLNWKRHYQVKSKSSFSLCRKLHEELKAVAESSQLALLTVQTIGKSLRTLVEKAETMCPAGKISYPALERARYASSAYRAKQIFQQEMHSTRKQMMMLTHRNPNNLLD